MLERNPPRGGPDIRFSFPVYPSVFYRRHRVLSRWICVKFSCGEHPVRRRSESDNILQDLGLVLAVEIDARDALVDAAHQLIRDGPEAVGKARQLDAVAAILAEDRDDVADLCLRHARDIDHAHVHADAADLRHAPAMQQERHVAREASRETVCIADADDGDAGRRCGHS